jgi:TonB family protein
VLVPHQDIETIEQLDLVLESRRSNSWILHDMQAVDGTGRTADQYASEFVFTAANEAKLEELRVRAKELSRTRDRAALRMTLREATMLAELDYRRLVILGVYFSTVESFDAQHAALQGLLAKVPATESEQSIARIQALQRKAEQDLVQRLQLTPQVGDGIQLPRVLEAADAVVAAYNEERLRLMPLATAYDRSHGVAPMTRLRAARCDGPPRSSSKSNRATMDRSSISDLPDYPANARRYGFEGRVTIRARVSATGCPEFLSIEQSVGYAPLDEEALRWAEGLRFHPVAKDGRPVDSETVFALTFRLK